MRITQFQIESDKFYEQSFPHIHSKDCKDMHARGTVFIMRLDLCEGGGTPPQPGLWQCRRPLRNQSLTKHTKPVIAYCLSLPTSLSNSTSSYKENNIIWWASFEHKLTISIQGNMPYKQ